MEINNQLPNQGADREEQAREAFPLRLTIVGGSGLVPKDFFSRSSDPYVLVIAGNQMIKTKVVKRNLNPEWNQELTFTVKDPSQPIRFEVFDKDTFSKDDAMGSAELDIKPFVEAVRTHRKNVGDDEQGRRRSVAWGGGAVTQDVILGLKLHNVACGELVLQLSTT